MIIGLGIDIVDLERIARLHARFGTRFLARILAPVELANRPARLIPWLGSRFAAKEAAAKALGTGFSQGITPTMIATVNDDLGKPSLILRGQAELRACALGVGRIHLSLSHERLCAVAVVILERSNG